MELQMASSYPKAALLFLPGQRPGGLEGEEHIRLQTDPAVQTHKYHRCVGLLSCYTLPSLSFVKNKESNESPKHVRIWCVFRIYVALTIFQPYCDLQVSVIQVSGETRNRTPDPLPCKPSA